MGNKLYFFAILSTLLYFSACLNHNPNINQEGEDELKTLEMTTPINRDEIVYNDTMYVPIYSDIYTDASNLRNLLAATLSIRNTSFTDSLYISVIDYYNTQGDLVRNYIDGPISLPPMASINYVVEREDDTGGSGANFIVALQAKNKNIKPLIQAIMIGQYSNKGFAFTSEAYSLKNN